MTVRALSSVLRKKAEEEVNETPNVADAAIAQLRDWLHQKPHLRAAKIPDQWLIAFLRGSKFNINKAQEKLDTYYTLKTIAPEIAANRHPFDASIQEILKIGFFLPLRKCSTDTSPRTCLVRVAAFNGTKHSLTDLIKVALMIIEILLIEDDNFTICGEEAIVDVKNLGFGIISQWTPTLAKKVVTCAEKSLSVRLKSMHVLNAGKGLKAALQLFKLFLGSKMKTRIHLYHKDYEKMYRTVDKSILPVEYGGTDGHIQDLIDHWKMKVETYSDWYAQHDSIRPDESKSSDAKNSANVLGIKI
ncbi:hypothetical protein O3G_MSEX004336 [Manduca sexta]|uniref:CRAL-TRIO domain-containing protein n=1 Tax=Manduca sexta TaxID=7130 RepID=A0A921YWJ5_MANSE|nr:hypothetical protein O3G_MSEX004336 [Manduca sexta]